MKQFLFSFFLYFLTEFFELFLSLFFCLFLSLPDVSKGATQLFKTQYIEFYDTDGNLIDKQGDAFDIIDIELIPMKLIEALVACEDKNFFKHQGVDYKSLLKNLYINISNKKVIAGGSTVSQQLAKNILQNQSVFEIEDRSILRKIKEILLTYKLEKTYSKNQILYLYLNRGFFGKNCYGIETASSFYFKKSASALDLYESVMLVGLLQSPSRYSSNIKAWKERAKTVLKRMKALNFITEEEEIGFNNFKDPIFSISESNIKFFTNYVIQNIPDHCKDRDIKINTTFNRDLYEKANLSLLHAQQTLGEQWNSDEGAFVLISKNGAIQVLIGGLSYSKSNFNIATSAKRPSGSVAKYFTYLTAIEMGLNPKSLIDDSPYSFGEWTPSNYLHQAVGKVQVDVAFAQSINSCAIKIIEAIDPKNVINLIRRLEIYDPVVPNLALTLGGLNTSLLNLTKSFLPIINKGYLPKIHCINEIIDVNTGEVLYKYTPNYKPVIDERSAYYMWQIMKRTVSPYGSGRKIKTQNGIFGGKSGTSNDNKDLYFILANVDYCIGCWFGRTDFMAMKNEKQTNLCIEAINKFFELIEINPNDLTFDITINDLNTKTLDDFLLK